MIKDKGTNYPLPPEKFYNVSQTQLSVARFSGGCYFNSHYYVYNPLDDSLTREDVLKKEKTNKP